MRAMAHKFEEVIVFARQQGFLLAFHPFDRVLEEAVLFTDDVVEKFNRLSALSSAFHAWRHERMV